MADIHSHFRKRLDILLRVTYNEIRKSADRGSSV